MFCFVRAHRSRTKDAEGEKKTVEAATRNRANTSPSLGQKENEKPGGGPIGEENPRRERSKGPSVSGDKGGNREEGPKGFGKKKICGGANCQEKRGKDPLDCGQPVPGRDPDGEKKDPDTHQRTRKNLRKSLWGILPGRVEKKEKNALVRGQSPENGGVRGESRGSWEKDLLKRRPG